MAHASDTIAFKPGGRVTVGFEPRETDDWPVDNRRAERPAGGPCDGRRDGEEPAGQ